MKRSPSVLFVTPILGHPPKGGPELRIENSIKALSKISTLSIYSRTPCAAMGGARAVNFFKQHAVNFNFAPFCRQHEGLTGLLRRMINRLARAVSGRNLMSAVAETESDYGDVVKTALAQKADVIWLGYGNISYPLLRYIKQHCDLPVVLDTDSVWSRFVERELPFAHDEAERARIMEKAAKKTEEEQWGTQLADVTTGVSKVDMEYYQELVADPARVRLFSNVIDLDSYEPVPAPKGFKKPCMYLAGTFWPGSPMEDAARWTLDNVLPLLKQEVPDIHFYIAGRASNSVLADVNDASVTITGELPSVLPYLCNASVVIVPLRFESGTRFKILEAGACGTPVVSTRLGAEGIPVEHGQSILLADTPEDFTQAIIKVLQDQALANSLGANLRELIVNGYSLETLADEGRKIINYAVKG